MFKGEYMKKSLSMFMMCTFAFGLGFGLNNIAFSDGTQYKIGVINAKKITASSKSLKAADQAKQKQVQELLKLVDTAKAEVQKQKTPEAKKAMVKKYENQLAQKEKAINDSYAKKVKEVNDQITNVISQKAKEMGYNIVIRNEVVIYGGDDMTNSILPFVK